ncbi:hypothetical protein QF046_002188 [Microbacterium sp. W4I4]|nr:hypothetical protein [Microbacterium sp. W4I4]MDQ0614547.1 hypothetical protein [Microbacterium sp. W4I4]
MSALFRLPVGTAARSGNTRTTGSADGSCIRARVVQSYPAERA